ncbi:MAG: ribbon-helix-helix protein, CopG family [Neisseriaceae bacterium]|nr:ribbon-helix-helix protein, CopG family [Neisseriaceae bacterium]
MSELRTITTQVPESLFVDVEKIARENDRSKSWIMRQALQIYVSQCKNAQSQPKTESEADRRFKDELFAMIQEAHDSGEDMNFEPPPRENVWKHNPFLDEEWREDPVENADNKAVN